MPTRLERVPVEAAGPPRNRRSSESGRPCSSHAFRKRESMGGTPGPRHPRTDHRDARIPASGSCSVRRTDGAGVRFPALPRRPRRRLVGAGRQCRSVDSAACRLATTAKLHSSRRPLELSLPKCSFAEVMLATEGLDELLGLGAGLRRDLLGQLGLPLNLLLDPGIVERELGRLGDPPHLDLDALAQRDLSRPLLGLVLR